MEVAHWGSAAELVPELLEHVPADGEASLQSTSNGPQGPFYDMAQSARAGQSRLRFHFHPWYLQPEFSIKPSSDGGAGSLDDTERSLVAAGASPGQVLWRRRKIAELGSVAQFQREYPSTPDEAFQERVAA